MNLKLRHVLAGIVLVASFYLGVWAFVALVLVLMVIENKYDDKSE